MEQKVSLKTRLYVVATFVSLAAGCLAMAIEVITQFYLLRIVLQFLTNLAFAFIIAGVVFLINVINIRLITYIDNKTTEKVKAIRLRVPLSFVFSSIPLFIGYLLIRFMGNQIAQKIDLPSAVVSHMISHQTSPWIFIVLFLCIMFFSTALVLILLNYVVEIDAKQKLELENAQLKIKNIEANYQQLKQQVNPHFLFNSLTTLKSLITNNPDAEIFLKRLSDFLRASVSFNNDNVINLAEELKFCMDYLNLQKVRFGDALQFSIHIPEAVKSGVVPVFSIQQLIENAIKHNVLTISHPLHINVEYKKDRIVVSNNIRIKDTSEKSTGVGLINLSERYKILSGDEVVIRTDNNCFSVSIKILDHENSNHRG